jgi:hypothetical protein
LDRQLVQRTMNFRERPACLLRWLRVAAWVAATGAATLTALAQAHADSGQTEPLASTTEPADAAEPNAAALPASEAAPDWNHRRVAPGGVGGQLQRLVADLKLDAAQQAEIRPILVTHRSEVQRVQSDTQLAPAVRQQRILMLGDRAAAQIRAQLTDAQRARFIQPRAAVVVAQAASIPGAVPARK